MRIELTVLNADQSRREASHLRAGHVVHLDGRSLSSPESLFDAMASALDFPDYFGRNWDALYECFSDYFIVEDGGLGSEFGGRTGVDADAVTLVFDHSCELVRDGSSMAADIVALVRYTGEANVNRSAADLLVEFLVDDPAERPAVEAVLATA